MKEGLKEVLKLLGLASLAAVTIYTAAIGIVGTINTKRLNKLSSEQRAIVQRLKQEGKLDREYIAQNTNFMALAIDLLESAKVRLQKNDAVGALDTLINAKGCVEKINPKIFDTARIRAQILEAEKELGKLIKERLSS